MTSRIIVFMMALCFSTSVSQALVLLPEFSGTVTDSISGLPISGVVVTLVNKNLSDTTDAQGKYGIAIPARVEYSSDADIISRNSLVGNHLILNISKASPVTVELFSSAGAKIMTLLKDGNLSRGSYDINLSAPGVASGVYMVRVRQGDSYWVHQYLPIQGNVTHNAILSSQKAIAKKSDATLIILAIDDLKFSKSGYGTATVPVPSYTSNTFNAVLEVLPDTDTDGNVYHAVTIGTQVWMTENLKTTKYNDGTAIPLVTNGTTWGNLSTPGYCWYDNDITKKNHYGALYNWYAVNAGKLAPIGWHIPSDSEWTVLSTYLGGTGVAGGKLKEAGTTYWSSPNTGAVNTTGFSALPGGYCNITGDFAYIGTSGYWWSSTADNVATSWSLYMSCNYANVTRSNYAVSYGFSVRCVKNSVSIIRR